jgi:hypothetical protein
MLFESVHKHAYIHTLLTSYQTKGTYMVYDDNILL